MIFVPFGSSPPPHSLVTKSTGTDLEHIISEGQHIAARTAGKAPKFPLSANNPLPIARSADSIVVPHGRIPRAGGTESFWRASAAWGLPAVPTPLSTSLPEKSRPHPEARPPRSLLPPPGKDLLEGMSSPCLKGGHAVGFGVTPHAGARSQGSSSGVRCICPAGRKRGKRFCEAGATPVASYGSRPAPEGCGRAHVGVRRLWGGGGSRAGRRGPTGRRAVKEGSRRREQPDVPLAAGPPGPPP